MRKKMLKDKENDKEKTVAQIKLGKTWTAKPMMMLNSKRCDQKNLFKKIYVFGYECYLNRKQGVKTERMERYKYSLRIIVTLKLKM